MSPLSRKSIGKESTFEFDQNDSEVVLSIFQTCWQGSEASKRVGLQVDWEKLDSLRGFETHTHGKSIPVAMDDEAVFLRLAQNLFAQNVEFERPIRLIGFRLGNLEIPETRQSTFDFEE